MFSPRNSGHESSKPLPRSLGWQPFRCRWASVFNLSALSYIRALYSFRIHSCSCILRPSCCLPGEIPSRRERTRQWRRISARLHQKLHKRRGLSSKRWKWRSYSRRYGSGYYSSCGHEKSHVLCIIRPASFPVRISHFNFIYLFSFTFVDLKS